MTFLEDYGHLRTDPGCRKFNPELKTGVLTRGLSCGVCKQEREQAQAQAQSQPLGYQDRGWFQKLAAEKPQEEPEKAPELDWDALLRPGGAGGPTELPGALREAQAQIHAQFLGWKSTGFSEQQAFALTVAQLTAVIQVQTRWKLEQDGGA